jgi:CPA2 family monovalent cation:H+ antiporter-2
MAGQILGQILVLLAASVLVLSVVRRFSLPPILGYLVVGMLLGPHALGFVADDEAIRLLAEIGVVFLVFTLGLEFSLARMIAMKAEVFGVGGLQMLLTTLTFGGAAWWYGVDAAVAVLIGGALSMASTAIVVRQLREQLELTRTHARYAIGILLFQDLAFAPLLGLATAITRMDDVPGIAWLLSMVGRAVVALLLVLAVGRWALRPLFHEIARHRSTETFTLTVLFVVLSSAWATHALGLSMALGGFLAGMLLAETEFRHQTEAVIKPFHDILLGLFFVSVGMLLDLRLLLVQLPLVLLVLTLLLVVKALIITLIVRQASHNNRKALRTGIVTCMGGEFGFALLTVLFNVGSLANELVQALLTATALSMLIGPLLVRYNERIADRLLRHREAAPSNVVLETAATRDLAQREHVVICGFGRVGQNLARVLERRGFEFIAIDLDPHRVRDARQAGDPVIYGDATHPDVLRALGLDRANIVVITFADPEIALRIVTAVRRLRGDVPVLVRSHDDVPLESLQSAGATEVVPEIFETSLSLVAHVLVLLDVPSTEVTELSERIRSDRYSLLRSVFRKHDARPLDSTTATMRQHLRTVTLPPTAHAVGRSIRDLGFEHGAVVVTAIRREGIVGRDPDPETRLREGDVLVLFGADEDLEHGESRLLMG